MVGHSGSGKSTIAKLLSGFYKVDSGVIEIGGYPLESYTKEAIVGAISFVFQDSKLFKSLFMKMWHWLIKMLQRRCFECNEISGM